MGFMPMAWLLLSAVVVAAGFEQAVLALLPVALREAQGAPEVWRKGFARAGNWLDGLGKATAQGKRATCCR